MCYWETVQWMEHNGMLLLQYELIGQCRYLIMSLLNLIDGLQRRTVFCRMIDNSVDWTFGQ